MYCSTVQDVAVAMFGILTLLHSCQWQCSYDFTRMCSQCFSYL